MFETEKVSHDLWVPDYVTKKKLRVNKERYLLIRERNDYNLGEKWWDFRTFLPAERLSRRFGTAMTPPLAPPWSKLFSRNQKWCSRTSTLFFFFFFRLEGGVFVVASSFKSFILKLHGHGNVYFSQHFSAPLLFSPHSRAGVFEISLIALKKTENGWLRDRRK